MNDKAVIRFLILAAPSDGSETIVQIEEHFEYFFKRRLARDLVISSIESLFENGFIEIEYPPDTKVLEKDKIEDYWFVLTEPGKQELNRLPIPPDIQSLLDQGL